MIMVMLLLVSGVARTGCRIGLSGMGEPSSGPVSADEETERVAGRIGHDEQWLLVVIAAVHPDRRAEGDGTVPVSGESLYVGQDHVEVKLHRDLGLRPGRQLDVLRKLEG